MWGWLFKATPRNLVPRKGSRYPRYRRRGLSQVQSGRVWKIQIPFPYTGVRTSVRPACRNSLYPLPDRQCRRVPYSSKWKLPCTEIPINFYQIILPFDSVTTRLGAGRSIFRLPTGESYSSLLKNF